MSALSDLKSLARGTDFSVTACDNELILTDQHGTFTFANNSNGYEMAAITLRKWPKSDGKSTVKRVSMPIEEEW